MSVSVEKNGSSRDKRIFGKCLPNAPPTPMPTPNPISQAVNPGPTSSPTVSRAPTSSHLTAPWMDFNAKDAASLVHNTLREPDSHVEFRNVRASAHGCYRYCYNGDVMGHYLSTNQQLLPTEGMIMSSGNPEAFCSNDSHQQSTIFDAPGDPDLDEEVRASFGRV